MFMSHAGELVLNNVLVHMRELCQRLQQRELCTQPQAVLAGVSVAPGPESEHPLFWVYSVPSVSGEYPTRESFCSKCHAAPNTLTEGLHLALAVQCVVGAQKKN